jgi:hypothetical protein
MMKTERRAPAQRLVCANLNHELKMTRADLVNDPYLVANDVKIPAPFWGSRELRSRRGSAQYGSTYALVFSCGSINRQLRGGLSLKRRTAREKRSLNSRRATFPTAVLGSSSTNWMYLGRL